MVSRIQIYLFQFPLHRDVVCILVVFSPYP